MCTIYNDVTEHLLKKWFPRAFLPSVLNHWYTLLYKFHQRRDAKRCLRFHLSFLFDIIRPECIYCAAAVAGRYSRDNADTTFSVIPRHTRITQLVTYYTSQIRVERRMLQIAVILSLRIPGTLSFSRLGCIPLKFIEQFSGLSSGHYFFAKLCCFFAIIVFYYILQATLYNAIEIRSILYKNFLYDER